MTENELAKVKILDERVKAKTAERDRLYEMATNISPKPFDDMPHSNTGMVNNKTENAIINIVALNEELEKAIYRYTAHRQKVIEALERLPEKEYKVLHMFYIRYMSWEEIANEMHYSRVQIWRFWKKGLKILKDETK